VASNRENQGAGTRGGSTERGFAAMNDEEQRRIAQKGGDASSREQKRDEQGQFDGSGGSSRGGSQSQGGSSGNRGGQGGSSGNRGGQGGSSGNQGGGGSNR
jgi:uncharacterized protein